MENLVAPEGPYQHTDDAFQAVLNDLCQVLSSLKQRCLAAERLAKKRGKIIAEREATLRTRGQGHAKLRASTISREKHQEALREVVAEWDAIVQRLRSLLTTFTLLEEHSRSAACATLATSSDPGWRYDIGWANAARWLTRQLQYIVGEALDD